MKRIVWSALTLMLASSLLVLPGCGRPKQAASQEAPFDALARWVPGDTEQVFFLDLKPDGEADRHWERIRRRLEAHPTGQQGLDGRDLGHTRQPGRGHRTDTQGGATAAAGCFGHGSAQPPLSSGGDRLRHALDHSACPTELRMTAVGDVGRTDSGSIHSPATRAPGTMRDQAH